MESDQVNWVLLKNNASISVAESISNSMALQGAAFIENLAKLARQDLDAIIAKNASRIVNYYGGSSSSMSTAVSSSIENSVGVKGLKLAKSLIKVGGVLGVIDVAAKTFQSHRLYGRGDYDAAAYAATGAIGGVAMLAFALTGPVGVAIGLTGLAVSIASGVKLAQATDSALTTWVKGCFWGGVNESILGFNLTSNYFYWDEINRKTIESFPKIAPRAPFKDQLEISKLISGGKAKAIEPSVSPKAVRTFFENELNGLNDTLYMPRVSSEDGYLQITLPAYAFNYSLLEVTFEVTESVGSYRDGLRNSKIYQKNYHLTSGAAFWEMVSGKLGTFKISTNLFKEHFGIRGTNRWNDKGRLSFTYYPLGKNDDQAHYNPQIDTKGERSIEQPNPMVKGSYIL